MEQPPVGPWSAKWTIESQLDTGGQGFTWLVHSRVDSSTTGVLKILRNQSSAQSRRRMLQEVTNLQIVAAAGGKVPHVLDHNTPDFQKRDALYFVMNRIEGTTLDAFLRASGGSLRFPLAIKLVKDLAQTLDAGHKSGVLHRDIKPKNVIVLDESNAEAILLDFGLSFNQDTPDDITRTGEQISNRFLGLPEGIVAESDKRDPRSDITVLCGILYYCLSGRIPGALADEQRNMPHRRAGGTVGELPDKEARKDSLITFFDIGFQVDIEARYQTIGEFLSSLNRVVSASQGDDVLDPLASALKFSETLKKRDLQTILFEMKAKVSALMDQVYRYVNANADKLRTHGILMGISEQEPFYELPAGYLKILKAYKVMINTELHRSRRSCVYQAGIRGEMCCLFFAEFAREWPSDAKTAFPWVEVVSFPSVGTVPSEAAGTHFKNALARMINSLQADILAEQAQG